MDFLTEEQGRKIHRMKPDDVEWGIASAWNELHPVGTPIRYWPGERGGKGIISTTRTLSALVGGIACVWIEGHASPVALSHVEVIGR